jgi:DNA-binding NtrC family response regulator/tetratricopeptide (TPR) repeat protein
LVALDDLELGPADMMAAIETFRCRPGSAKKIDLLVATETAPPGASAIQLPPLDLDGVRTLLGELDVDVARAAELERASSGNPGFVVAAIGRVPLTRDAALERARRLSPEARRILGALSLLGGRIESELANALSGADARRALAELAEASLVVRRAGTWVASLPSLALDLAEALSDFDLVDALADILLEARVTPSAGLLLALAEGPHPPTKRELVLRRAAELARAAGLRSEETRALLALAADPKERSVEVLTSLDRLTRGGGSAGLHPEIVTWLGEAGAPELEVLALRRRAEQLARAGESDHAQEVAARALAAAERRGDPAAIALALATSGAVALYRSDWTLADVSLARAAATLATGTVNDAEEIARLHHNRGVVALFRGRLEESRDAFVRSIEAKRGLGDRAGLWACLLNLGLSLGQLSDYDAATRALDEAVQLCRALGQVSGLAWCLAAHADVAVRRGDAETAERWVAEAEHLGDSLPEPVKADLALLRADVALLEGAGGRALEHVAGISQTVRDTDPLISVRALVAEARAHLCTLPANRRLAARLAIRGARIARKAQLPEPEARALAVLRSARGDKGVAPVAQAPARSYDDDLMGDSADGEKLWTLLGDLARGVDREHAALGLARFALEAGGAERAFVLSVSDDGRVNDAWGVDLDGLPIADARGRVDEASLRAAVKSGVSHQPSVDTRGGRGSRIVVLAPERAEHGRAGIVLEHRFSSGCFDQLDETRAARWALFAGVVLRIGDKAPLRSTPVEVQPRALSAPSFVPSEPLNEPSTVLPFRGRRRSFPSIVGGSAALDRALSRLDAAVDSDLPVLISGETGVGKELFARALHDSGPRATGPFVAINCGAVPDSLFEAELFGHARGSFTGADRARAGLIARAEGGTLLLDEIGELPLLRQATLLRALATRSYRPVGSDEDKSFDVRIVAATNRALDGEVEAGRFRRDLLYRLNVLEIQVPPLRDRPEDVLVIARHVLSSHSADSVLTSEAARALESYDWPGNVRELEHQMQRIAALGVPRVELEHLSREVRGALRRAGVRSATRSRAPSGTPEAEREAVIAALDAAEGNITHAARRLSMTRQGLKKKMVRLGLREVGGQK